MSFSEYIEDFVDDKLKDIHIGMIGKIEKFDGEKMRAAVKPLMKFKNKLEETTDYPILIDVPVNFLYAGGFYIRPPYEAGDLVWIGFSTFGIDGALKEETREEDETAFNMENACIMGSVAKTDFSDVSDFSEDGLLIGHKNGTMIQIKNGEVNITGADKVNFLSANESYVKGNTLQTELNKDKLLMQTLQTAINAWTPVAQDGGAALKAALVAWLALAQADYSQILSTKIKGE